MRETFGQESVTLLEYRPGTSLTPARQSDPASWQATATVGGKACAAPDEGETDIPAGESLALVLRDRPLPVADRRILEAFAAQAAAALRQQWLAEEAERTRPLAEADWMRTALLSAVIHDLRIPLSSAMAAVESLANLATNAVRYSPANVHVLVTASGHNDRVDLRIADRGPGIPSAERDRVFQLFQRLGDRDNHTGVGLGLALPAGSPKQ